METTNEITQYLDFLKRNQALLNKAEIARRLDMDKSTLHRALKGTKDRKGFESKIPQRCIEELKQIVNELSITG